MSDLIKQVGGIEKAKDIVNGAHWENVSYSNGNYYSQSCGKNDIRLDDLRQAIADYNTDHCTNIENHISPSTKVIEK